MLKKYLPLYRVLDYNQIVTTKEPKSFQEKAKSGFQLFKGTLFNGTKSVGQDLSEFASLSSSAAQPSSYSILKKEHIMRDMFKVGPFLFLMILPGGSLLIPLLIGLFPYSIPTQYLFEDAFNSRLKQKHNNAVEAFKKLQLKLQTSGLLEHQSQIKEVQSALLTKRDLIEQRLNIRDMSSDELFQVCRLLHMEAISKTINFLYNLPSYLLLIYSFFSRKQRQFEYIDLMKDVQRPYVVEVARKFVLMIQLRYQYNRIFQQDVHFSPKNDHKFIKDLMNYRGILDSPSFNYESEWVQYVLRNQLTPTQKLWYSVLLNQLNQTV